MFALFRLQLGVLYATPRLALIILLLAACLAIVGGTIVAAHRRHLHIPAYVGMAFAAFVLAMAAARFSGSHGVSGTPAGIALSIIFFLLIALVVGSVLALFFYRHPEA